MKGFKNTTKTVSGHRHWGGGTVGGTIPKFARGGSVPDVYAGSGGNRMSGNTLTQRANPPTEELKEHGGKEPLISKFAKGGHAKHFHVHKHYHSGGRTRSVTHSYAAAEKHAEKFADGGHVHDSTSIPPGSPDYAKGGKFIQKAIKHPGALHKQLGVPQGKKIPAAKLAKAAHAPGKLGQRARFAETLKGLRKNAGGAVYATGGTINKLALGGVPLGGTPAAGALGRLALRPQGLPNRAGPPMRKAMPMPGPASPMLKAKGGAVDASRARTIAHGEVMKHVSKPAPTGHAGLGKMIRGR